MDNPEQETEMSIPEEPDHAPVQSPPSTKHSFQAKVNQALASKFQMNLKAVQEEEKATIEVVEPDIQYPPI